MQASLIHHHSPRPRGIIMNLGCLGMIVCVALLWSGGQEIWSSWQNRRPVTMSCADYLRHRPSGEWLQLTGCDINLLEAVYSKRFKTVGDIYLPIRAAGTGTDGKVALILKTRDRGILEIVRELADRPAPSTADTLTWAGKHADRLFQKDRMVSGMMQFGIKATDKERHDLESTNLSLAPNWIIIEEGGKPSFRTGITSLALGLLLLGFMGWRVIRTGQNAGPPPIRPAPAGPPVPPPGNPASPPPLPPVP